MDIKKENETTYYYSYTNVPIMAKLEINGQEKILKGKNIISMILFLISLLLILDFIFTTDIAWLNYYSRGNSAPFYLTIVRNGIVILGPSLLSFIGGIILVKMR